MTQLDRRARVAGGLYALTFLPGFFSLMYVPDHFIVSGNPAATIANIMADESLFRWGVLGEVIGSALWVVVVVALYRLFADVDRFWAWLMAALGGMCAPIMLMNVLSELQVLTVLADPGFAAAFSQPQLQKLIQLLMRSHGAGFDLLLVFSGLWLFPFAVLVWRCGFLPRALAVLQTIGGLGYLASACASLLSPPLHQQIGSAAALVSFLGETPTILWLLFMGAKARRTAGDQPTAQAVPAGG